MLDFIRRIWFGVRGSVFGSFKCSVVKGLLFIIVIASYRRS